MLVTLSRRSLLSAAVAIIGTRQALAAVAELDFKELYVRGTDPTEKTKSLAGQTVTMRGFMAPPLKAEASFFVLTKIPMAVCPFCDSTMDWPEDIVLVLTGDPVELLPFTVPITVEGSLAVGFRKEPDTGFVSFIRLEDATYWRS